MNFWTLEGVRSALGGSWLARASADTALRGVSIDSRSAKPGQVFIAIRGENHDGHQFVHQAADRGCPLVVVETAQADVPAGVGVLRVDNTRAALTRMATAYRKALPRLKVVAVTGSCGKTTTVRLIHAVLSQKLRGSCPVKSFNNAIGVPLTLLSVDPGDQYVVCEVGTSGPGEIDLLARICMPDVAVITCIGRAHLEKLGSVEGVAIEKSSLLNHLAPGGMALLPADAPMLQRVVRQEVLQRSVWFGTATDADLRVEHVESTSSGVRFSMNGRATFEVPLPGAHNAINAAAAVGVGRRLGLDDDAIRAGLIAARGAEMRLETVQVGGLRVLNDAYNANPDSMLASLRTLQDLAGGRRVAIIGTMLELGDASGPEHDGIGRWIAEHRPADLVVFVGPEFRAACDIVRAAVGEQAATLIDQDDQGVWDEVAGMVGPGDTVLLKASRGVRLERVLEAIERRYGPRVVVPERSRASR